MYVVIGEANKVSYFSEHSANNEHQQNSGFDSSDEVDHISKHTGGFQVMMNEQMVQTMLNLLLNSS